MHCPVCTRLYENSQKGARRYRGTNKTNVVTGGKVESLFCQDLPGHKNIPIFTTEGLDMYKFKTFILCVTMSTFNKSFYHYTWDSVDRIKHQEPSQNSISCLIIFFHQKTKKLAFDLNYFDFSIFQSS